MASDWIKMRTDLYRDPKVCVMADLLMDCDGELARYVDQHCQRTMTVTRNVMRNVTVGALVSVWGVMRLRGKCDGDDLVCNGVTASVLDDISDLPGFGEAMLSVGWAEKTDSGVVFPRFFADYNVDPEGSDKTKAAERQARYRERQKAKSDAFGDVTRDVTVTPREEKRREEKKEPKPKAAHTVVSVPEHEEVPNALPDFQSTMTPEQKAVIPLVTKLRSLGVTVTSSNPLAVEWARKGLTPANAVELVEITRGRGKEGPIHPNYFTTLIDDFMKPKAPKPRVDDWYRSDAGISRKAAELGMYARPGDSFAQLRERCESEIRKREGVAA